MLLRSGIGPAEELQRLGITPRVDRRGVGRNLQNHPYLHFALTLPPRSRLRADLRRFGIAAIRLSSGLEGCPPGDLLVFTMARVSPRSFGADVAMVGAALYSPYSRGAVTLASADIDVPPRVAFNMFDDPRDAPRMLKAARFAEALLCDPTVAGAYNDAFLLPPVMALNQFNQPGLKGSIVAAAAKAVLNAPGPVTRWIVDRMISPGRWFANAHRRADAQRRGAARLRRADGASGLDLRDRRAATIRWRWSTANAASTAYPICASSMPRSCRASRARTPTCRPSWSPSAPPS